jgi:hypothetical protein
LYGRLVLVVAVVGLAAGCRQDMHDQPKFEPLERTVIFDDERSSRQPVAGTVARGQLGSDPVYTTGLGPDGQPVATLPVPVTAQLLHRGQERYGIFCSPCHDMVGSGQGMIVRRGYKQPQSFHSERLRQMPVGYFFDVMTNGFGQMPSYASQVHVADRWAIAAYLRTLQVSQGSRFEALPESDQQQVEEAAAAPAGGDAGGGHGGDSAPHGAAEETAE